MNRVYGVGFQLWRADSDPISTATAAIQWAWEWAAQRGPSGWPNVWTDGELESDDVRLLTVSHSVDMRSAFRLRLTHRDEEDVELSWQATVEILASTDRADFACSLEQDRALDLITPERTAPGTPRIVRDLVDAGARNGRHALASKPMEVAGSEAMEDFVEGMLCDPDRRVPIVALTSLSSREGLYAVPARDISWLAVSLAGLAHVVTLPHKQDTFELTARLGSRLSVFNGAVRIYWPRFNTTDSPFRHHLYLADRLEVWHVKQIRQRIVDAAVRAYRPNQVVAAVLAQARIERNRLDSLHRLEQEKSREGLLRVAQAEANEWIGIASAVEADNAQLKATIGDLEEKNRSLEARVDALQYQLSSRSSNVVGGDDLGAEPASVEGALTLAAEHFAGTLHITEHAREVASRMNPADNSPAKLWRVLRALHNAVAEWQLESGGRNPVTALRESGLHVAYVSKTTRGRYESSYRFRWKEELVWLSPHVDLSRGERVYWYQDENLRVFVINHIGEHLPDSTTG